MSLKSNKKNLLKTVSQIILIISFGKPFYIFNLKKPVYELALIYVSEFLLLFVQPLMLKLEAIIGVYRDNWIE